MGSNDNNNNTTSSPPASSFPPGALPDADSPLLVLTHPTPAEREATWRMTYPMWGGALTEDDYLAREVYLTTVPLARDGGITHWVLTVASLPPGQRPILSSCESIRKRAVVAGGAGGAVARQPSEGEGEAKGREVGAGVGDLLREGIAHGVASVFTGPAFRGRGYASRMMKELGKRLKGWQVQEGRKEGGGMKVERGKEADAEAEEGEHALFSVLYSDIGRAFYARHGWAPFQSSHVSFKPVAAATEEGKGEQLAKPIGYHELAELCAVDERLLRADLASRPPGRPHAALLPELDAMLWHLMREDFMTKSIFGRTPTVRGAVAGAPGKRVWAVWMRGYYGGLKTMEGNTLHVLRVVIEDPAQPVEELVDGFRSIVRIAQTEAAEWRTKDVQVWNPPPKLRRLVEECGIEFETVDREREIASLLWYGEEPTAEVDWVANEKYAWC